MANRLVAAAASTSSPLSRLITRRGLADQDWTPNPNSWKVNLWESPMRPMSWKESHFRVATVVVWGGLVFGGIKLFCGEKENKEKVSKAKTE